MGNRYILSGVQLVMLQHSANKTQMDILEQIENNQWIGESDKIIQDDVKKINGIVLLLKKEEMEKERKKAEELTDKWYEHLY